MSELKTLRQPLPYTSSPALLALQDLWLFLRLTFTIPPSGLPSIVLPFYPFRSGHLDELYPSPPNIFAITLHIILILTQSTFLILLLPSLFFGLPIPLFAWTPTTILSIASFIVLNNVFCILLNGTKRHFQSLSKADWHPHNEKWIFINGVAAGSHWMQSNLDRLALTFHRPIVGIHNRTRGIIFDVIETIIQRTFGYATPDVRDIYTHIMTCLDGAVKYDKVVLILHSQGAVEGGLVLDWLFATIDQEILKKLEIYTFGSAANHFNSPVTKGGRVVKWIEHYANLDDYVARFGILHFRPLPKVSTGAPVVNGHGEGYASLEARAENEDRYVSRLFVRKGSGHQMNGNYLDSFFPMAMDRGELTTVLEENEFMSSEVNERIFEKYDIVSLASEGDYWDERDDGEKKSKVKDLSRLWQYRNGGSPDDNVRAATWPVGKDR